MRHIPKIPIPQNKATSDTPASILNRKKDKDRKKYPAIKDFNHPEGIDKKQGIDKSKKSITLTKNNKDKDDKLFIIRFNRNPKEILKVYEKMKMNNNPKATLEHLKKEEIVNNIIPQKLIQYKKLSKKIKLWATAGGGILLSFLLVLILITTPKKTSPSTQVDSDSAIQPIQDGLKETGKSEDVNISDKGFTFKKTNGVIQWIPGKGNTLWMLYEYLSGEHDLIIEMDDNFPYDNWRSFLNRILELNPDIQVPDLIFPEKAINLSRER